jgi:hypothetical protein
MELRLIAGEGRDTLGACAAVSLDMRSRRPAIAHEELELPLGSSAATAVAGAAHDRLPTPLWAVIAIESERVLEAVTPFGSVRTELAARLDTAARLSVPVGRCETRLHAWAAALRSPPHQPRQANPLASMTLDLVVPYHTLLAWNLAAERSELELTDWAQSLLTVARNGRALWEATAAEAGCTLAEWMTLSALTGP